MWDKAWGGRLGIAALMVTVSAATTAGIAGLPSGDQQARAALSPREELMSQLADLLQSPPFVEPDGPVQLPLVVESLRALQLADAGSLGQTIADVIPVWQSSFAEQARLGRGAELEPVAQLLRTATRQSDVGRGALDHLSEQFKGDLKALLASDMEGVDPINAVVALALLDSRVSHDRGLRSRLCRADQAESLEDLWDRVRLRDAIGCPLGEIGQPLTAQLMAHDQRLCASRMPFGPDLAAEALLLARLKINGSKHALSKCALGKIQHAILADDMASIAKNGATTLVRVAAETLAESGLMPRLGPLIQAALWRTVAWQGRWRVSDTNQGGQPLEEAFATLAYRRLAHAPSSSALGSSGTSSSDAHAQLAAAMTAVQGAESLEDVGEQLLQRQGSELLPLTELGIALALERASDVCKGGALSQLEKLEASRPSVARPFVNRLAISCRRPALPLLQPSFLGGIPALYRTWLKLEQECGSTRSSSTWASQITEKTVWSLSGGDEDLKRLHDVSPYPGAFGSWVRARTLELVQSQSSSCPSALGVAA